MKKQLIFAIALFALATPGLAAAETPAAKPGLGIAVRYNDLDLQNARDAKVMLHRIRSVAVEICQPGETGFEATARFETCYQKTVAQTVTSLDAPRVTEALNAAPGERKLARLR
jgi:UrcA family protein